MKITPAWPLRRSAILLLLPGFDEVFVAECYRRCKLHGATARLLGLSAESVPGETGMSWQPDYAVRDFGRIPPQSVAIVPGGAPMTPLITEPRIHRWLSQLARGDGHVLLTTRAAVALARIGWVQNHTTDHATIQVGQRDDAFIDLVLEHCLGRPQPQPDVEPVWRRPVSLDWPTL